MRNTKSLLLASAAVAALGLGFSSDAKAFESVDWNWEVNVLKNITETITINDSFDLSGLVTIEAAQINIGDVTAEAYVDDFENNPPGNAEGTVIGTFNAPIDLTADVDSNQPNNPITAITINSPGLIASNGGGNVDENENEVNLQFDLSGEVEVDLANVVFTGDHDAIDLPKIENIATAVANNFSVDSTVGLNLHEAQYNFGGFAMEGVGNLTQTDGPLGANPEALAIAAGLLVAYVGGDVTDNPHSDLAIALLLAGGLGAIDQGSVDATAIVGGGSMLYAIDDNWEVPYKGEGILNASVENSATAVANNISVGIEATLAGDAFMVADFTQFNYADVNAYADVSNVDINNYTGFGAAGFGNCGGCLIDGLNVGGQTPIISNVATAVGNNISVTVSNAVDPQ